MTLDNFILTPSERKWLDRLRREGGWIELSSTYQPAHYSPGGKSKRFSYETFAALRRAGVLRKLEVRPGEQMPSGAVNTYRVGRRFWFAVPEEPSDG